MAFCYFVLHIHILAAAYIMMPIMAPIAMKGLNKDKKGSLLKDILGIGNKTKPLIFQSTEEAPYMNQYENKEQTNEKRKKGIAWTKLFRIQ